MRVGDDLTKLRARRKEGDSSSLSTTSIPPNSNSLYLPFPFLLRSLLGCSANNWISLVLEEDRRTKMNRDLNPSASLLPSFHYSERREHLNSPKVLSLLYSFTTLLPRYLLLSIPSHHPRSRRRRFGSLSRSSLTESSRWREEADVRLRNQQTIET